ncbi:MAG: KamA family radical SAM protein [candidate division KSB1 bacterium]|nr:KamA family radical SAM protein [candidate division KSB1 bacterium]
MFDPHYTERMFNAHPIIHGLLKNASSIEQARDQLLEYLENQTNSLNRDHAKSQPLKWHLQHSCLENFLRILSPRSDKLAGFSVIELLWNLAKGQTSELPESLDNGFFEEMIHMFRGLSGESGVYIKHKVQPFTHLKGREAALERSQELDKISVQAASSFKRFPTGLDKEVIRRRHENQKRIRDAFGASEQEWNDYLWQIRHVIRDSKTLAGLIEISSDEKKAIDSAKANRLPFGITPYYVSLMDKDPSRKNDHAVRAQVIPPLNYVELMTENRANRSDCFDFMHEHDTSPIDLITRRYPRICILKPYNTCSQICVYCQRNWEIDDVLDRNAMATEESIDAAVEWMEEHETVSEVLVTGGDPLIMNTKRLNRVLEKVARIKHIERIRLGSRTPVVLPQRFTDELVDVIASYHEPGRREMVLVTHFIHPYEITPESMQAVQKIRKQGMSAYNQSVFTMENSRRFEHVALRRALRLIGVDPYYTFNTKGKKETENYRVPLARLMQEIEEEARIMPGMLRTDEPVYNVPRLGKNYIRARQHHTLLSVLPDGSRVYEFHPWEKYLSLVNTYVDTDVPIYKYLEKLKERGENPDDYRTIWYYY